MWNIRVVTFYTEFSYKLFELGAAIRVYDETYDASSGYSLVLC
jgi:hypothetical protein